MPLHAIPFALAVVQRAQLRQSIDLQVGTIFNNIAGFFVGILSALIGDIITPIADALNYVAGVIIDWIVQLWAGLRELIGGLPGDILSVVDLVDLFYNNAITYAQTLYDDFITGISATIEEVLNGANWLRDWITAIAQGLLADALSAGGPFVQWIYDNVINPLETAIGAVTAEVEQLVAQAVADALDAATSVGGFLWDEISSIAQLIVDDALGTFTDLFNAVLGAYDFLIWVGEHSLSWFSDQIESFFADGSQRVVELIVQALENEQPTVDAFLDATFG